MSLTASKRKLAPGKTIDATIEVYEDTECLDTETVQKALKTTKISEMPLRLRDRVDLKNDVKVNPVSAHEKAKLLSQSQMKKTSTAPTSMNRGTEKQVNLKETFEEAAARVARKSPEHENYQQRMPHQSPIVVASASNAAASKGITNMDIDDEAASKRNEQWLPERPSTASKKESEHISQIDSCENEKSAQNSAVAANADEKAKPSAGARWTKDEGGFLQNSEPTMTFCTKEAWGDVMAMFSDRGKGATKEQQNSNNEGTKSASSSGYEGDASQGARKPKASKSTQTTKKVEEKEAEKKEEYDGGFLIREDTGRLPENIVVSKEETNNKNNDFDFDIREDTECIPSMNEIKKGVLQQKKCFGSPIAVLKKGMWKRWRGEEQQSDDEIKVPTGAKSPLNDNTVKRFDSSTGEEKTVLMAVPAVNDDKDNTVKDVIEENIGTPRDDKTATKIIKEIENEKIHLVDPFENIDILLKDAKIESNVNVSVSNDPLELDELVAAGKRVSGAKAPSVRKRAKALKSR